MGSGPVQTPVQTCGRLGARPPSWKVLSKPCTPAGAQGPPGSSFIPSSARGTEHRAEWGRGTRAGSRLPCQGSSPSLAAREAALALGSAFSSRERPLRASSLHSREQTRGWEPSLVPASVSPRPCCWGLAAPLWPLCTRAQLLPLGRPCPAVLCGGAPGLPPHAPEDPGTCSESGVALPVLPGWASPADPLRPAASLSTLRPGSGQGSETLWSWGSSQPRQSSARALARLPRSPGCRWRVLGERGSRGGG